MTRAAFLSVASAVCLIGCNAIVSSLAPNRDAAAIVFFNMRDTIFIGDSLGVFVDVNDKDGKAAWNDTVVVWQSSNAAVVSLDASHPPVPTPHGFSWLYAKGSGQATVTAHTINVTASKVVTVLGPGDVAANDQRLGYALADQPNVAGPYSPDAAHRFNSGGGAITVTRDSVGWYRVRFAGLGRKPGQRDNVQVTAHGAPGTYCKLYAGTRTARTWSSRCTVTCPVSWDRPSPTANSQFSYQAPVHTIPRRHSPSRRVSLGHSFSVRTLP